jgi:hypothetical protein
MSYRTCPNWPDLMEIAADLQFKHYSVSEAQLPGDALVSLDPATLDTVEICCDLDRHVYYAAHTATEVVEALKASHWFELSEWTTTGPGTEGGL